MVDTEGQLWRSDMTTTRRILIGITLLGASLVTSTGISAEPAMLHSERSVAVLDTTDKAFGRPLANLSIERFPEMLEGKMVFVHRFAVDGPQGLGGLGPLYVADSCIACHFKDGRGGRPGDRSVAYPPVHPPKVFRLGPHDTPSLGHQLQDRGVGIPAEGYVEVSYREEPGRYDDGETYSLRRPTYRLTTTAPRGTDSPTVAPRIPPTLVGVGLLEAVAPAEVLALADPEDTDGDGISGRASLLSGPSGPRLGRFGWKAGQATLEEQVTAALAEDMGVDTHSDPPELSARHLERLVLYLRLLAPPARRETGRPGVRPGERLFAEIGCTSCHHPELQTAPAEVIIGPRELASQRIRPYTDLLLHDMGSELADDCVDPGDACRESREWRTAPLWGLGLLATVNGEAFFLHDGRARTFEEAILWHGGEAAPSRRRFTELEATDRKALLAFLDSL